MPFSDNEGISNRESPSSSGFIELQAVNEISSPIIYQNSPVEKDCDQDSSCKNVQHENSDDSLRDPDYEESSDNENSPDADNLDILDNLQEQVNVQATEDVLTHIKKGKKRKRQPDTWQCNIRKQKHLAGEEYLSKRKNLIKEKSLGPPCAENCRRKCTNAISQAERENIFRQFWLPSKSIDHKRQFVASCVQLTGIKRKRERTGARSNQKTSNKVFTFTVNNVQVEVCQTFFLNTLAVSQTFVSTALSKKGSGGLVDVDKRGRKVPPNKISPEVKDSIRNHILKFPSIESHYSRERSSKRYLDSNLNISRMYNMYKEDMLDQGTPEDDIPKLWLYTDIFNTEFNYSFKVPANDTCDECDRYLLKLKDCATIQERLSIQKEYDEHLTEASKRYALKKLDKRKDSKIKVVIMVDLEKCLPTPSLTNSQYFYSLKLWTFNYTIKDA